jgi:hypothetical protein
MKTLCPFGPVELPLPGCVACVDNTPFFSGPCDYGHALIGLVAASVPTRWAALTGLGFVIYESLRTKPVSQKVAGFGQFGVGFLVGKAVQA